MTYWATRMTILSIYFWNHDKCIYVSFSLLCKGQSDKADANILILL